jgi:hypothetical protein
MSGNYGELEQCAQLELVSSVDIAGEIHGAKDQIEADGIQIRDFTGVASFLKLLSELPQNGMAEGSGIGVGKYGQDPH